MNRIKVFAPATIANLNVGFDVLGMPQPAIGDTVELRVNGTQENRILTIENGGSIPTDPSKNCSSVVIKHMQNQLNEFIGVDIMLHKGFGSGSGMGSSSASSAGAAYAYNSLVGRPFTPNELVFMAAEGERAACGTPHLDNVAPAILGGITLVSGTHPRHIIALPTPEGLIIASILPDIEIQTQDARNVLRRSVDLPTVSYQVAKMGAFISSLYEKDLDRLAWSLEDVLIEPHRKVLIPGFDELRKAALKAGALGFGISGSGPAVFALCGHQDDADRVVTTVTGLLKDMDISSQSFTSSLDKKSGCRTLSSS